MAAEIITLADDVPADAPEIRRAAEALRAGAVVVFPTETVYGVGVNAASAESVERLRDIKGRTNSQPFTVHIARRTDCDQYAPELTALARRMVRKGWPGPLTLIFPVPDPTAATIHSKLSPVGAECVYGQKTVGIRCPDHPVGAALLAAADCPVIASSANESGAPPPTEAQAAVRVLADRVDVIVDAGPCRYRAASTIVAVNGDGYRLLRTGVYDARTIQRLAAVNILFVCTGNTCRSPMAEGMFKKMMGDRLKCDPADLAGRGVVIQSAGTAAGPGGRVSDNAVLACRRRGIDIAGHVSRPLNVDLIRSADYIYTMAENHLDAVRALAPVDAAKAVLLDPAGDISDPAGGDVALYEKAAERIANALEKQLSEVAL